MFWLYAHGGSKNHGCEALVRSTVKILASRKCTVFSGHPEEDITYQLQDICCVKREGFQRGTLAWFLISVLAKLKLVNRGKKVYHYLFKPEKTPKVALSIGGDNYCYDGFLSELSYVNRRLNKKGIKTVLWGCSIEPELLKNPDAIKDMKQYSLITARESITYQALLNAGIHKNTKLYPDPAFLLNRVNLPLPDGFSAENTVGINVSPLILDYETNHGITIKNYVNLIQNIIDHTDMQVALIPHVIWESNDDRVPLQTLYNKFKDTGRVVMVPDGNCMQLKGYISRCRMFVCARTHASIAAYSTCVPTLVVGYSVKAKGIAKDIFGTYDHYVIPVQSLKRDDDLVTAFQWLMKHENEIRSHLQKFMPSYCAKAWEAGKEIQKLIGENH